MPKVTGGFTAAIVALVLLTGCSAPASDDAAGTESPAPLVAETSAEPSTDSTDADFLAEFRAIRETMPGESQISSATDAQILAAGAEACARLDAGESSDSIVLVEGEEKNGADYYSDSGAIISAARTTLCPEHID